MINIGPIITFSLFHFYRLDIYKFCLQKPDLVIPDHYTHEPQDLGLKMALFHFSKRILECMFVHFYSKPTKSLNKIIWEMGYNWLFFGLFVPFYLFHPYYEDKIWASFLSREYVTYLYYFFTVIFLFAESMNFLCHLHLKSFRRGDLDQTRGIPRQHGFSVVSCANYFWEFLAWCAFTWLTQTLLSALFVFLSFFRMNYKAQRKHLRYIAEFKNLYPAEERRAFIPYLF